MKTKLIQFTASLLLAVIACGGSAAAMPEGRLPNPEDYMERPEDPVILPTDEETAQMIKDIRGSNIRML